jgi:hypothetical protein
MAAIMVTFICHTRAANVTWSDPAVISGDADVITLGTVDRAYNMGTTGKAVPVNGVTFKPFATNVVAGDDFSNGLTALAVSGDGDRLAASADIFGNGLTGFLPSYQTILQSGVFDQNSAMALTLDGLTVGNTYLIQCWAHSSQNLPWTETLTGGVNTSPAVKYNSTETASGLGQHIAGTFTADSTSQTITFTPNGGSALINAFQLRLIADTESVVILKQPLSATNFSTKSVSLSVFASGNPPLTYQWQKNMVSGIRDVVDTEGVSGATSNTLHFDMLTANDAGNYRVVVRGASGTATSHAATVGVLMPSTNQLINVAVNNGSTATYQGIGVLAGTPCDVWNSPDARNSFTNGVLMDSAGRETPVTLTLIKTPSENGDNGALRNSLLGNVSFAAGQTVTLGQLKPDTLYDLVVFSVGNMVNEGGVFTGAINGISHGHQAPGKAASGFIYGTNYIENPFALSDAKGTLTFTIKPTATVIADGWPNCDFNGLQLMKVPDDNHAPVILQQPLSVTSYSGHSVTLAVVSAGPPSLPLAYQWQKITANGTNNLADGDGISGSTTNALTFNYLMTGDTGTYQVVISNLSGAITSMTASIVEPEDQLINVAINNGSTPPHVGVAVLNGTPQDGWNSPDGRNGFKNIPLVDATGTTCPVTLTLTKTPSANGDNGAVRNRLLGDVSFAASQTVVLNHLKPNALYDLAVFSAGNMVNEGGVFSGAITGMTRGYSTPDTVATNFVYGTNYIETPYALSDAQGTLTFTIAPNSTAIPNGFRNCDFNGLQLRKTPAGNPLPVILQQPSVVKAYLHHPLTLPVTVASPPSLPLKYLWQKVNGDKINDLNDESNVSGSSRNALIFSPFLAGDAGNYRLVATSTAGSITSSIVTVTKLANQLINVAINNGSTKPRTGIAVLEGDDGDCWNSPDGRNSFNNAALVDSKGTVTPVTMTLAKQGGSAVRNSLLGDVCFASKQTVTLNNLSPDCFYDLVVFSVGNMANEGGVFSGAVTGIAHGYPATGVVSTNFSYHTNYVRNPRTLSSTRGALTFTIMPTATEVRGGFTNCDFNGLQLMEVLPEDSDNRKAP